MFSKKIFIGAIFGIAIIALNIIFMRGEKIFWFINIIALIISSLPFIISLILEQGVQKEKEEKFLEFSRDLVENVKSGTPISKSIINLQKRDYGALSIHVQKLANQILLGISLTKAFQIFAKDTRSTTISRAVTLISEAERAGGQIESILESVAKSVNQSEVLKKERKSSIYNLIVQGYILFFVFIIIMLVLEFKIFPMMQGLGQIDVSGLSVSPKAISADSFSQPLFIMLLVQSFFTGLVIGKISEGSLKNGIKHSFILLAITLIISTGAKAFLG